MLIQHKEDGYPLIYLLPNLLPIGGGGGGGGDHTGTLFETLVSRSLSQYKDRLSHVWDSHVKVKIVTRPSYL